MSTRAVLARPRGKLAGQFEGIYLHNGADGLRVLVTAERGYREVAFAAWGAEPDWDAIEDRVAG